MVKTISGLAPYIRFRKASTLSMVMSGRRAHSAGPQPLMLSWKETEEQIGQAVGHIRRFPRAHQPRAAAE
jgi:hypothetical protein